MSQGSLVSVCPPPKKKYVYLASFSGSTCILALGMNSWVPREHSRNPLHLCSIHKTLSPLVSSATPLTRHLRRFFFVGTFMPQNKRWLRRKGERSGERLAGGQAVLRDPGDLQCHPVPGLYRGHRSHVPLLHRLLRQRLGHLSHAHHVDRKLFRRRSSPLVALLSFCLSLHVRSRVALCTEIAVGFRFFFLSLHDFFSIVFVPRAAE